MTNEEHLQEVERQTGVAPPELHRYPMPEALEYVWEWWCRLHAMRPDNGMGFGSIGWDNIAAFDRLLGLQMMPEEVELVELIELEFRRYATQSKSKESGDADEPVELPTLPDDDTDEA